MSDIFVNVRFVDADECRLHIMVLEYMRARLKLRKPVTYPQARAKVLAMLEPLED